MHETSIICACAHLKSGEGKEVDRVKNIFEVTNQAFLDEDSQYLFYNHHIKFFFGDLNFRVEKEFEETIEFLKDVNESNKQDKISKLLKCDQLTLKKKELGWLDEFKEMPITFLPTYKFQSHSDEYDLSKKKRVPSWCDRILWHSDSAKEISKQQELVKPILYERVEAKYGDHKPVTSYFKIFCSITPSNDV